jgi:hypothetical protein
MSADSVELHGGLLLSQLPVELPCLLLAALKEAQGTSSIIQLECSPALDSSHVAHHRNNFWAWRMQRRNSA